LAGLNSKGRNTVGHSLCKGIKERERRDEWGKETNERLEGGKMNEGE
jgi:hypothetical protein